MQLKQDGVSWHLVGDDIVVLDLNGSMYLKLSGSGRLLWERLAEPVEEADLAAALVEPTGSTSIAPPRTWLRSWLTSDGVICWSSRATTVVPRPVGRLIHRRTLAWRVRELTTTAHVGSRACGRRSC